MLIAEVSLLPDKTLLIQLGIFLAVLWTLNVFIFKPLLKILKARFEKTAGDRKRIEDLTRKTESLVASYEERMTEARKQAHALKDAIRKEGLDQAGKLIHDAKELRKAELERVRIEVDRAASEAEKQLETQSKELGAAITEKVFGRKVQSNGN